MEGIRRTSFILLTIILTLAIQLLVINPVMAQGPNTTSAQNPNNTKLIVDLKNNTITLVDTITNETISVKNLTTKAAANTTTNENIISNGNTTTNENLIPENTTTNETLTTNSENATTNVNLTAEFNDLQGK